MLDVKMWPAAVAAVAVLSAVPASDIQPSLRELLARELRFSSADLADLEKGKVVAHDLHESAPGTIGAVGAVKVKARRANLVDRYRDIERFKRGADVMQIGKFGHPPSADNLVPLVLDKEDVDLRGCRLRDCDIRLPAAIIGRIPRGVDSAAFFKQVLFENVTAYLSGGADRIVEYDDQKQPVRPVDDFNALLEGAPYLDRLMPGLRDHLREYPAAPLAGAENFLYWSKEKFGITPFVTVTHVTIAPPAADYAVITSKDVYSSRYFDASLTVTIASDSTGSADAFYLVYVNRS